MTQEEVCSSVSNHAESRKSCQKRTRPPPNVEHQTVSPAALELLAEMEPWLWILLAALCFDSDTNPNLFWYKQDGTSRPQFILSRFKGDEGKTEDEFKERFSSTLNPTMKSVPLKIQELQLSDSAVYYCALRPTVTGSSRTTLRSRPKFSSNESRDRVDLQCPLLQFRFCCVRLCCEAQSDRKPTTCLQQHSTQLLEAFVTLEGHMTQEELEWADR
ncbi:hypothetical protein D4764_15G0005880 [Takifugu flavidus]|uniref:Ig-like domain-containing protein n=1 Tax=Takifugu flavidus TaxID=433684 RepID=A0A5C6P0A4_9TELE|nr:hypothetical protein D4764_15G0005880 [Takifugu flavidus]